MKLQVASVDGVPSTSTPITVDVTSSSTNCATVSGVVTCTFPMTLPISNDVVLTATNYSAVAGGGVSLGTATIHATVLQNARNLIPLSLGGTIAQLQIFLSQPTFPLTPSSASLVVVVPLDNSGAQIVNPGAYATPINVTMSSATHFHLTLNGASSGTAAQITSPNDQVALAYDGLATSGSGNVTATTTGAPSASTSFNIAGVPGFGVNIGGAYVTNRYFRFTALGQTGTINASGGTGPYTLLSSDPTAVSVSGSSPNFTVTAAGYGASGTGLATLTLSDSASTPAMTTENASVIAPAITVTNTSCGAGASCPTSSTNAAVSFSVGSTSNTASVFTLSGGTGSYSLSFVSSGSVTSTFAAASITGNTLSVTPNGTGSDALVITSGSTQPFVFGILATNFAQQIAAAINPGTNLQAIGFRNNVSFSATLPIAVTAASVNPAASFSPFTFASPALTAVPQVVGTGTVTFTDASGNTALFPETVFGFTPGYPGGTATEAFTGIGQSDPLAITGVGGTLSATTANAGIVTKSVSGNVLTLTSTGVGSTTVTITDSATGAQLPITVSVTTTTIPVLDHNRSR